MKKLITILLLSITTTAFTQMSGSYTVGGVSPDFINIQQAINALMSNGVNGPTIINIRDGNYVGQLTCGYIPGTDSINRVTFQSENQDSTLVEISYAATGFFDDWVLQLDSAQYVTFKWLTIKTTGTTSSYSDVINIKSHSDYSHIENCYLVGKEFSSSPIIYAAQGSYYNNVHIKNNHFYLGGKAISMRNDGGTSYPNGQGVVVEGNYFENNFYGAISLINHDFFEVKNNRVFSHENQSGGYDGFYFSNVDNGGVVANNHLIITGGAGIELNNCDNSSTARGYLYNNFISVVGDNCTGLSLRGPFSSSKTSYWNVYNNTVIVKANAWAAAFYFLNADNNLIYNNIFHSDSLGYSAYNSDSSTLSNNVIDFNNFYSKDSTFSYWNGVNQLNFNDFQTTSSTNPNSYAVDPNFSSITDYHLCNSILDNAGTSIFFSASDLDGDIRNPLNPDIGLDEFDAIIDNTISLNGNTLTVAESNAQYQWVDCNNGNATIAGETNQSYTPIANGDYAVIITKGVCIDTSTCFNYVSTTLDESIDSQIETNIYPNPTNKNVFLEFGSSYKKIELELYNSLGQVIIKNKYYNLNNLKFQIPGKAGVYIIKLKVDDLYIKTIRIIKKE